MKNKLNFIDLFCGAGGLSFGLNKAGHKCLLGIDFDKDSIETFKYNHKDSASFCGDIKDLDNKTLKSLVTKKIEMIVLSPPCQAFSTIGKGDVNDPRNNLFKKSLRFIKFYNPKIILLENVTGLLSIKNKPKYDSIIKSFENLGYKTQTKILDASLYSVPQKRKRVIIVGTKNCEFNYPKPNENKIVTVGDVIKKLKTKKGNIYNHDIKTAQISNIKDKKIINYIPEGCQIRYEKDVKNYLPKNLYVIKWKERPGNRLRQARFRRLHRDLPSTTILTSKNECYHPVENRYLTVREAAKLQSFPNTFKFFGSMTSQWKQVGNAVPPLLAYKIGLSIKEMK